MPSLGGMSRQLGQKQSREQQSRGCMADLYCRFLSIASGDLDLDFALCRERLVMIDPGYTHGLVL